MSHATEHMNSIDHETSAESQSRRLTAYVTFRVKSALAWVTPFILGPILGILEDPLQGVVVTGFAAAFFIPFGIFGHLLMKPIVYAENGTIIVVPQAGAAKKWQVRKPPGTYQMKLLPNGRIELKCLPWYSNFRPGGPLPSRMHLIPRKSDREEWIALAK